MSWEAEVADGRDYPNIPGQANTIDLSAARLTDLTAYADREIVDMPSGRVIWMTVDLNYHLPGLSPSVSIRVPMEYIDGESGEDRRRRALRASRRLIDHVCAATAGAAEVPPQPRVGRLAPQQPPVGPDAGRALRSQALVGTGLA
jgi:hypothetical protein